MLTVVRRNREHPLEELYLVDIERVKIDTSIKKAHCSTKPTYIHMIDNSIEGTTLKKPTPQIIESTSLMPETNKSVQVALADHLKSQISGQRGMERRPARL